MTAEPAPACAAEAEAVAWLQDELDGPRARAYEVHLRTCAPCQQAVADARAILIALADRPPLTRRRRPGPALAGLLAAALLLLAVQLITSDLAGDERSGGELLAGTASWHLQHLAEDGTWYEGVPRGLGSRKVGLHALALMALSREAEARPDAAHREAVVRAARWLVDGQGADGGFGLDVDPGSMDHVLATASLVEAWAATRSDQLGAPLDGALALLAAAPRGPDAAGAWATATLHRAAQLGLVDGPVAPPVSPRQVLASLGPADRLGPLVARSLAVLDQRVFE